MLLEERDSVGWVLKALRETGGQLGREFYGMDDRELTKRPTEDDLSLKEIAAHLRDAEELAVKQFNAFAARSRKVPAWDVDVLAHERDYRSCDLEQVLGELRMLRRESTHLLWSVSSDDWTRESEHPYHGSITLESLARELAQHDLEHLWQVRRIKSDFGLG
jgi:hypothetical protein